MQRRSKVSDNTMEIWRTEAVTGDLLEVPGIGPASVKKLAECDDRITNTYQLFGKYLTLKGPDMNGHKVESMEHNEKFWFFLKNIGISSHRSAIVKAIAEKAATFFRGIVSDATIHASDALWWRRFWLVMTWSVLLLLSLSKYDANAYESDDEEEDDDEEDGEEKKWSTRFCIRAFPPFLCAFCGVILHQLLDRSHRHWRTIAPNTYRGDENRGILVLNQQTGQKYNFIFFYYNNIHS